MGTFCKEDNYFDGMNSIKVKRFCDSLSVKSPRPYCVETTVNGVTTDDTEIYNKHSEAGRQARREKKPKMETVPFSLHKEFFNIGWDLEDDKIKNFDVPNALSVISEALLDGHPNPSGYMEWIQTQPDELILNMAKRINENSSK
jgi:hypothetical protein